MLRFVALLLIGLLTLPVAPAVTLAPAACACDEGASADCCCGPASEAEGACCTESGGSQEIALTAVCTCGGHVPAGLGPHSPVPRAAPATDARPEPPVASARAGAGATELREDRTSGPDPHPPRGARRAVERR